ncbi:MAG: penicillin-binding protein 1C [Bacteroides sp.]|nr:penicillin-binding protein 1C [Bacteroides sp.]
MSYRRRAMYGISLVLLIAYICCLPRQLFDVPYATVVTDRQGELLGARIATDGQWRFPPRDSVPVKVETCLLEFEDRYFYRHWGVNPLAMGRALRQNLGEGRVVSGGSTLTMQTIRLSRRKPRTLREKFRECMWATRLEFRYPKKKILAMYVSHAPFGGNVVGLDAASWRYFGREPEALSWAEAATLAILPNAPSMIHLSRGREALLRKRNRLLERLHRSGKIDSTDYELALEEPLPGEPLPLPATAFHLVDYFHRSSAGQRVVSTLDRELQLRVEEVVERWNREFSQSDIRHLAALVIDLHSHEVTAYCGNTRLHPEQWGNQVDVIRSPRSTGSILKPFLYGAMLQEGELLPHTLLPDIPMNINGFTPQNFNKQYEGAVPASEAVARSLNIPTVHMLRRYSVPRFQQILTQSGLSTLTRSPSHYGLSLILGGAEATLWDVTVAYADMARLLAGRPEKACHLLVENKEGAPSHKTPFHRGAVWQTFETLKEVNRPEEIDWRLIPSMQTVAWKTGTSYGFRDAWAVGVTPRYAVGVWVGNATGEGKPGLTGARTAGPVMFDIFNLLPASGWFEVPYEEFTEAEICTESGHLKGRFCDHWEQRLVMPAALKTEVCPYHHPVCLTADESFRLYASCAEGMPTVECNWFTLPPAWEWYYRQHHPNYRALPPLSPDCGVDNYLPMQFIYPQMNARIVLPRQLDGSAGNVTFELAHSDRHAVVYWHLNDTYLSETRDFHKLTLTPEPGRHSLTVVDDKGNRLSVAFVVE